MAKVTPDEARELAKDLKPFLDDTGKDSMDYCRTCGAPKDHRHIATDLEIEKDRHQRDVERLTEAFEELKAGHPAPKAVIPHWETCPNCKPEFDSWLKPKLDEAYRKGRIDALTDPTPDEVPKIKPRAVGDWIKYYHDKEKREKAGK